MKKANFNTLQNLPVPENWIENALAIPEKEAQEPVFIPLWRKPRFIAAAASLVLVSGLSIALFLATGLHRPPVAVKPAPTGIVQPTDEISGIVATEAVTVPDITGKQETTQPTEAKSPVVQFFERIFGSSSPTESINGGTAPTTAAESGRTYPTEKTASTEVGKTDTTEGISPTEPEHRPAALPTEPTAVSPTEAQRHPQNPDKPTEAQRPTESSDPDKPAPTEAGKPQPTTAPAPTEKPSPTEPEHRPTSAPTDLPEETESPSEARWEGPPTETPELFDPTEPRDPSPTEPSMPTEPKPTEDPDAKYYHDTLTHKIPADKIPAGSTLYIKLIDGHGNLLGDPDLYSDQHLVTVDYWNSRYVGISYTPNAYGIIPKRGYYRYKIYNQDGVAIEPYYRAGLNP